MSEEQLQGYHDYTRKHGVNWPIYLLARMILQPAFLIYLRLSRQGRKGDFMHRRPATANGVQPRSQRVRGIDFRLAIRADDEHMAQVGLREQML